ncbi:MAG: hypothetical protein KatS3mg082_1234 [Nitrospiraceae bacterium]|nr:MAG: hypothetical protein KatS3mg082_1234 [Nitrospiraceae bacterium]
MSQAVLVVVAVLVMVRLPGRGTGIGQARDRRHAQNGVHGDQRENQNAGAAGYRRRTLSALRMHVAVHVQADPYLKA